MIRIEETTPEAPGKLPPDGRFSSPHQANEIYVSTIFHGRILSDSGLGTKREAGIAGLGAI
jgi:hypothetical protein